MNKDLYLAIIPFALIFFNFWTLKFYFGRICDYVLDKEFREIKLSDLPPVIRNIWKTDDKYGWLDELYFVSTFFISLFACLLWGIILPIVLLYYSSIYSLRSLRFIVRLSRGLKQVSSVAHSHNNNEIIKEKINEIKF